MKHASHQKLPTYQYHIVAVGDSLTQGVGDLKDQGYAGLTVDALKKEKQVTQVTFKDYGHMGDTTKQLLRVLQRKDVQQSLKRSNMIFMTIGGNDIAGVLRAHFMDLKASDFASEQKVYAGNLRKILTTLRTLNAQAPIYFFTLYNPFEDYFGKANKDFLPILDRWNNESEEVAADYPQVTLITTKDIFAGKGDQLLYSDHFHPNKKGYMRMRDRLLEAIQHNR
ncbi:MAG: SGNH/GDSL hydrolase family protein [Sporolactobacillus sp.]